MFEGVEMPQFGRIYEFLISDSQFEMPELSNVEKLKMKVVSNLTHFKTNYFFFFATIFLSVFFIEPLKMIYIVVLLALVFGVQYYMSLYHEHVWKGTHPTAVMSATFVITMFFLYQFGWFPIFFRSILMPILLIAIHTFLYVKGENQTMIETKTETKTETKIETKMEEKLDNKYSGVSLNTEIKGNGRKKLLLIGKTGAGKSSLCNIFTGHPYDAKIFPVSAAAVSCTQSTQFADVFFKGDKEHPVSIIDTIGFDDPENDTDASIISDLVFKLRDNCDHVNLFIIAVNGQHPRLDSSLIGMIRIFEGMFGEEFWSQVILVFTMLSMDEKAVKKRLRAREGKTDEELANDYLEILQSKFPKGKGMKYLLLDSCYDDDDKDEKESFDTNMGRLLDLLDQAPSLPTSEVQSVETESKQLKNMIEEKDKKIEAMLEEMKKEADLAIERYKGKAFLERKFADFKKNRKNTISELQEIADYIDKMTKYTGIAKVVGSSGGVASGALTLAGGVATVLSGGLAAPLLFSGLGLGLGSGLTGGLAAVTQKIIESSQMKRCQRAIEIDEKSTEDLVEHVESVKRSMKNFDTGMKQISTVSTAMVKGVGLGIGGEVVAGAGAVAKVFGDDVAKLLLSSSTRVLTGSLTAVLGGVMIPWDLYNLSNGIHDLLSGDMSEASKQIRKIADELKKALDEMTK